jgi:hypothetical protein
MEGMCGAFEVGERERRSGREGRAKRRRTSLLQRGLPPSEKHRGLGVRRRRRPEEEEAGGGGGGRRRRRRPEEEEEAGGGGGGRRRRRRPPPPLMSNSIDKGERYCET